MTQTRKNVFLLMAALLLAVTIWLAFFNPANGSFSSRGLNLAWETKEQGCSFYLFSGDLFMHGTLDEPCNPGGLLGWIKNLADSLGKVVGNFDDFLADFVDFAFPYVK